MKILFDECVTHRLRHHMVGHDVHTVSSMGWDGVKNGRLLARAAAEVFDAMLTTDRGIQYEQDQQSLPISVYLLEGRSSELPGLVPRVAELLVRLANEPADPTFVRIVSP